MGKSTVIPFGPQHPVLPEPIHLDLELQDEKVVRAVPSIGYVHRGLEKLVELRDFQQYVYVAERVCGICSFGHGWGYSRAVEEMMEIEVPGGMAPYYLARIVPYPFPSSLAGTCCGRYGV